MSQGYGQYGGNPYGHTEGGYGGQSNPYGGGGYGSSNPYGGGGYNEQLNPPAPLQHNDSNYSQPSQYSQTPAGGLSAQNTNAYDAPVQQHGSRPLSQQDFLARIEGTKTRIGQLTADIQSIAAIHQRMLGSPDTRSSAELEGIVSQTSIRNTAIKDEIRFLEQDAVRDSGNSLKRSQIDNLKRSFHSQLKAFEQEESDYSKRYREAIARQYRIINPDASEQEVKEAANADWGDEGIFTQALKSNRSGQASSVLGAVRARHNDIQRIEKTMAELSQLFMQLDEQVTYQEPAVAQAEEQTTKVVEDTENANTQLTSGIKSARNARKLKWWILLVVVIILAIIAAILAWYFTAGPGGSKKN